MAAELASDAIELRRDLHRFPELADEEHRTTARVIETLEQHGVTVRPRITSTGLTAQIGSDGPMVGFRADLDALPIHESTVIPFRSEIDGLMHACGHDAHTAIATYATVLLHRLGLEQGQIRVLFQPAEESFPGGAVGMVRDGLLDGVEQLLAFHVDPSIPAGVFGVKPGPITASSDRFEIEIEGPGGHTARPHETVDTVRVAGHIASELPDLLSSQVDARDPVVTVFGSVHGGQTHNVIPTKVTLGGTCRTVDAALWDQLGSKVEHAARQLGELHGAKVSVHYQRGIPPVINDPGLVSGYRRRLGEAFGADSVRQTHTSMGAEDFARYLDHTRGALVRLGAGFSGRSVDLHSASFDMDESAIEYGIAAAAIATLGMLEDAIRG